MNSSFYFLLLLGLLVGPVPAKAESGDRVRELSRVFGPAWIEGKSAPVETFTGYEDTGLPVPPPNSEFLPFWLPMCFLFDPKVNAATANEKVKRMTSSYAACGIVLEPYVATLRQNYPDDPESLAAAARVACPFTSAFGVRGAIQLELRSSQAARKMCSDPTASGCSTLCSPLSVSFVAPNAGPVVGLHESMHSNCCGPVCVNPGEGAGIRASHDLELASTRFATDLRQAFQGPGTRVTSITPEGCQALRAGSSPNKFIQGGMIHWYEPSRELYVTLEQSPERQFDLMSKRSLLPKLMAVNIPAVNAVPVPRGAEEYAVPRSEPIKEAIAPKTSTRELASMSAPVRNPGRGRARGAALRKMGDPTRKFGGGEIGTIDVYSDAEGAKPSEASPGEAPFQPLDTIP